MSGKYDLDRDLDMRWLEDKPYYDIDGNETTLYKLVRSEPDWAMSRIKMGDE